MWSEPQLDELSSGGVLRVLEFWSSEGTTARSAVLRWRLVSSGHPLVIFRCM